MSSRQLLCPQAANTALSRSPGTAVVAGSSAPVMWLPAALGRRPELNTSANAVILLDAPGFR
jgi:hypothetical protein